MSGGSWFLTEGGRSSSVNSISFRRALPISFGSTLRALASFSSLSHHAIREFRNLVLLLFTLSGSVTRIRFKIFFARYVLTLILSLSRKVGKAFSSPSLKRIFRRSSIGVVFLLYSCSSLSLEIESEDLRRKSRSVYSRSCIFGRTKGSLGIIPSASRSRTFISFSSRYSSIEYWFGIMSAKGWQWCLKKPRMRSQHRRRAS
mmetsp:Transcript_13623/g.24621  ORF Transcript_13623/g.24621 Transcript_13623/m.24621 type:complete len:202 (+) Transcript_13623:454-1059(+)